MINNGVGVILDIDIYVHRNGDNENGYYDDDG